MLVTNNFTVALGLVLFSSEESGRGARSEWAEPQVGIENFRAVHVSSAELQVTVEYSFADSANPDAVDVWIHATPEEAGGVFDPRTVVFEELPVRAGMNTATMAILRRPGARVFTSLAVRVCISTEGRALLCRDFLLEKVWTPVVLNPPAESASEPSPPPPVAQTCSISGEVTGPLRGSISPDHPGEQSVPVRLDSITLTGPGIARALQVPLRNRRYTFRNVPAGVVYRVFPSGFRSDPRHRTVSCRANTTHRRRDFRITGPPAH